MDFDTVARFATPVAMMLSVIIFCWIRERRRIQREIAAEAAASAAPVPASKTPAQAKK
jgi:hypothetical protein